MIVRIDYKIEQINEVKSIYIGLADLDERHKDIFMHHLGNYGEVLEYEGDTFVVMDCETGECFDITALKTEIIEDIPNYSTVLYTEDSYTMDEIAEVLFNLSAGLDMKDRYDKLDYEAMYHIVKDSEYRGEFTLHFFHGFE